MCTSVRDLDSLLRAMFLASPHIFFDSDDPIQILLCDGNILGKKRFVKMCGLSVHRTKVAFSFRALLVALRRPCTFLGTDNDNTNRAVWSNAEICSGQTSYHCYPSMRKSEFSKELGRSL